MALTLILLFSLLVSPTGTQQGGVRAEQAGRLCLLSVLVWVSAHS